MPEQRVSPAEYPSPPALSPPELSRTGIWPGLPDQDRRIAGDELYGCPAAITDVVSVMGDSRRLTLIAGGLLAADFVGTGSVVSVLVGRGHVLAVALLLLLVPVLLGWLGTAAALLLAEWPVAGALGRLRQLTGAPVDLSAPWAPLGVRSLSPADLDWNDHVLPLIGAAHGQHSRARFALSASLFTTAAFFIWMAISLAAALVG